jgi:penicillin-binding protein 1B
VLAIEDQRFYSHSGVNPVRLVAAAIRNATNKGSSVGYSTITQQLARMFFLADEFNAELQTGERGRTWGSYLRKAREIMMSLALERRASKDEILEMYLNDVYLGQRGSFAIHGVAEASRIFFGKDVANVTNSEAATIAGTIKFPGLPFQSPKRATDRRNLVLQAMASEEYLTADAAAKASKEPLQIVPRAVDAEAPYFVDMIVQQIEAAYPGLMAQSDNINVFTTLDLNLQRRRPRGAAQRPGARRRGALEAAVGSIRARLRPRWWRSTRATVKSWRSLAAVPTTPRSTTASRPRAGSPARSSNRSSTSPPSSAAPKRGALT